MHGIKRMSFALMAAGLIGGPLAANASETDELKARLAELEKQVKELDRAVGNVPKNFGMVQRGEEDGYIKWPGSQTGFNVYGYAHLAVYKDLEGRNAGDWAAGIGDQPGDTVGDNRKGKFNMTARQSRLGVKTVTLTDLGTLRTKIEGDFVQSRTGGFEDGADSTAYYTGGYMLRLRHAYGELSGEWGSLLAGQSWSNFMSGDAIPETLDFNGSGSTNALRNPQVRYTANLGGAGSLAVAIENSYNKPSSGGVNATGSNNLSKRPDVTVNWTKSYGWGFVSAQLVNSEWLYDNGTLTAASDGNGWGLSGQWKISGADTVVVQLNGGEGLGRYVTLADYYGYGYNAATNEVDLAKTKHWSVGYARAWTDSMRTNLALSGTTGKNGDGSDGNKYKEGFVNAIWGVAQNTEFGVEYNWGTAEYVGGAEGKRSRVMATFQYNF